MWKGLCLTNQSYSRDNRLIFAKSPYRREGLAPRCWLILSWSWRRFQGLGCSPMKGVPELSLERRETVWFLPGVRRWKNWGDGTIVREDLMPHATGVTVVLLKAWLCSYAWIGESLKAYQARNFPQDKFFQKVEKCTWKIITLIGVNVTCSQELTLETQRNQTLDWNKPWKVFFSDLHEKKHLWKEWSRLGDGLCTFFGRHIHTKRLSTFPCIIHARNGSSLMVERMIFYRIIRWKVRILPFR